MESKKIQANDKKNLAILNALFEEGVLVPSLKKIAKHTGLSKQTVYQRLKWMKENGVIINYVPAVNPFIMGVKMLNFELVKVNLADDDIQKKFSKIMQDKHIIMSSS